MDIVCVECKCKMATTISDNERALCEECSSEEWLNWINE